MAPPDLAILAIQENADRQCARWRIKHPVRVTPFENYDQFVRCVIEELGEFIRAIYDGDDLPALELIQVGGLVVNALRMFDEIEITHAWQVERDRHPYLTKPSSPTLLPICHTAPKSQLQEQEQERKEREKQANEQANWGGS